jgi:hypothetical protein
MSLYEFGDIAPDPVDLEVPQTFFRARTVHAQKNVERGEISRELFPNL